jgi:hypothetical protein
MRPQVNDELSAGEQASLAAFAGPFPNGFRRAEI